LQQPRLLTLLAALQQQSNNHNEQDCMPTVSRQSREVKYAAFLQSAAAASALSSLLLTGRHSKDLGQINRLKKNNALAHAMHVFVIKQFKS